MRREPELVWQQPRKKTKERNKHTWNLFWFGWEKKMFVVILWAEEKKKHLHTLNLQKPPILTAKQLPSKRTPRSSRPNECPPARSLHPLASHKSTLVTLVIAWELSNQTSFKFAAAASANPKNTRLIKNLKCMFCRHFFGFIWCQVPFLFVTSWKWEMKIAVDRDSITEEIKKIPTLEQTR